MKQIIPVTVLFYDPDFHPSYCLIDVLHLIAASEKGILVTVACTPDNFYEHVHRELTYYGFDWAFFRSGARPCIFHICGRNFPLGSLQPLSPWFERYRVPVQIHTS